MGTDKPGLVDLLAKCVYQHNGNWQGSSFAKMAGQFTGFVEVHAPEESHQAMIDSLNQLDDLHVQVVSTDTPQDTTHQTIAIEITSNDKPGIVREVTEVLSRLNVNIVSFDSCCESAPSWGSMMFKARTEIALLEQTNADEVRDALEGISDDIMVDVSTPQ